MWALDTPHWAARAVGWLWASRRGCQVDSPLSVPGGFNTSMPSPPWHFLVTKHFVRAASVLCLYWGYLRGYREATGSRLDLQPNPNALCLVLIRAPVEVDKAPLLRASPLLVQGWGKAECRGRRLPPGVIPEMQPLSQALKKS